LRNFAVCRQKDNVSAAVIKHAALCF